MVKISLPGVCVLCLVVAFTNIDNAEADVKTENLPKFLSQCFGLFKKRTNMIKTPGAAIVSFCMAMWQNKALKQMNIQNQATEETKKYIQDGFSKPTKEKLTHYQGRRVKRQAGTEPAQDQGPLEPLRIRREIRTLSKKELKLYIRGIQAMKANTSQSPNVYEALVKYHTGITSNSAHGGCNFHGWHRCYLLMFENALREQGPEFAELTLPYWDSRLDQRMKDSTKSCMFSNRLVGTCDGEVRGSFFGNKGWESSAGIITRLCGTDGPLFDDEMVFNVTQQWNFKDICGADSMIENDLEFHHNGVHRYCDGQMATLANSPHDPIFWLHHCFMDLLWETFRKNQIAHGVDPEIDYPELPATMGEMEMHMYDADMGFNNITVGDGLSSYFTEEIYQYAPPPTCTPKKRDCGSVFLKCVVDKPGKGQAGGGKVERARCVSRTMEELKKHEDDLNKPKPKKCPTLPKPLPPKPKPVITPKEPVIPDPKPDPKPKEVPEIKPIQNTFCMNGRSDIGQWVYIPVKIIFKRPPNYKQHGSYPVENGKIVKKRGDIYSPSGYSSIKTILKSNPIPAGYNECGESDSPTKTIYVKSVGLNYDGTYKEYAIIDKRLALTVATAYLAVRKPLGSKDQSIAMLTAQDNCGRVCKAVCKVPGTETFRPCSGAVKLTGTLPLQYGNSFGDAVMNIWDFNSDAQCPQLTTNKMIVSFYCDYKPDWNWPSIDYKPTRAGLKIPNPNPVMPREKSIETTIIAACNLGYGCHINKPCAALVKCNKNEFLPCMKSCHTFARCMAGSFMVFQCARGKSFSITEGCKKGPCDYSTSGVERSQRNRNRGKRPNGRRSRRRNFRQGGLG